MDSAIALPARFRRLIARRHLLAVTHDLQIAFGHALFGQDVSTAPCAAVAESEVVFRRPALVAMTFDDDLDAREIRQHGGDQLRVAIECGQGVRGQLSAVVRAQLVQAQEEERRAIARELHDEVGQSINAILLQEAAGPLRSKLEDAVASVRRIALSLRPSMLDDLGLVPALEWQAREIGNRTGLNVEIEADAAAGSFEGELPEAHRTCIFRVAQEALRNAVRHARAKRATVGIARAGRSIALRVEDDGRGFTPSRTRGLGLLGMEERVAQLGGTFRVTSEPGRGTVVRAELPL